MKEQAPIETGEILGNDLISYVKISVEFLINNPNDEMFPLLLNLVNGLNENSQVRIAQVEKEPVKEDETFCKVHDKKMKERKNQQGGTWFDHRQQTKGEWELCYGSGFPSEKK